MKTFILEIITPEKVAYKKDVEFLVVPAAKGELGVLPGHIDYLAMLTPGELRIKNSENTELFAISGGFAEIHPKNVVVLCETAESAEEIDIERVKLAKQRAEQKLKISDEDLIQTQLSLQKALTRLKVVSDLQKRKQRKQ
ncbi:MAG: F0F1 ATP synthase subunit epsilon [Elusimicrobiota bacterium]